MTDKPAVKKECNEDEHDYERVYWSSVGTSAKECRKCGKDVTSDD